MSSKKNRNKNKRNQNRPSNDLATKELTKQLNAEDDTQTESDTGSILAEYEKNAEMAEKRKAERQRQAELEQAEREKRRNQPRTLDPKPAKEPPVSKLPETEPVKKADNDNSGSSEADVKKFVPHSGSQNNKDSFTEGFNEALSENYDDISDENDQTNTDQSDEEESEPERPNKFYLVFAVFVIIMSIIGVISTVNFTAGIISDIANRTDLKNELALFLYPVVCVDPPDCDKVEELPSSIIIEAALWRIILTGDNSNYERLYNTYMYVPAVDVEFSVRSIFGNTAVIEHQTARTMDMSFTYIEDMNSYLVPVNPHYTAYSPRIKDVTNVGELYTVTVEYIPPSALSVKGIEFEEIPTKTMVYTLSKSKNATTLHSIKNITRIGNSYEY